MTTTYRRPFVEGRLPQGETIGGPFDDDDMVVMLTDPRVDEAIALAQATMSEWRYLNLVPQERAVDALLDIVALLIGA